MWVTIPDAIDITLAALAAGWFLSLGHLGPSVKATLRAEIAGPCLAANAAVAAPLPTYFRPMTDSPPT